MRWNHQALRNRGKHAAGDARRSGLKPAAKRFVSAWPFVAPTLPGCCVAGCTIALWYCALLLDERTLIAAALAVSIAIIADFLITIAQFCGFRVWAKRDEIMQKSQYAALHANWRTFWWPHQAQSQPYYHSYDFHQHPVGPIMRSIAERRGYYRCEYAVIQWRGPLGLFKARRAIADGTAAYIVPKASEAAAYAHSGARNQRNALQFDDEQSGMVRPYAPGDSPQHIAWHHTARYDDVMVRDSRMQSRGNVIIWLDIASVQAHSESDESNLIDAMTARAAMWAQRTSSNKPLISDGVAVAQTSEEHIRLFACAGLDDYSDASDSADVSDSADSAASARASVHAQTRETLQAALANPRTVIVAVSPDGDAAARLSQQWHVEQSRISVDVVAPPAQPVPLEHIAAQSQLQAQSQPIVETQQSQHVSSHARSLLAIMLPSCITAVALYTVFASTITAISTLIQPGYWTPFAYCALALVAFEFAIPNDFSRGGTVKRARSRRATIVALRCAAVALITVIAAVAIINSLSAQHTGMWLLWPTSEQRQAAAAAQQAADLAQSAQNAQDVQHTANMQATAGRLEQAVSVLRFGFGDLYRQLPPLQLSWQSDIVCIIGTVIVAIMLRLLLLFRTIRPLMGVLPFAAISASALLTGSDTPWWWLAAVIVAWIVSLATMWPHDAGIVLRGVAVALVAALSLYSTPTMLQVAYGVPLSFGESRGLLSSNMVNPIVDLRRSPVRGSSEIALQYKLDSAAQSPQYLRMSTLGDFDGNTWRFDERFADDANLYGSGIQLGAGSEAESGSGSSSGSGLGSGSGLSGNASSMDSDYAALLHNPWSQYFMYESMSGGMTSLQSFSEQGTVKIGNLTSRFLPTFGLYNKVSGLGGDWSSWLTYEDGSQCSHSSTTFDGMSYEASGLYMQPISDDVGFDQVDSVVQAYQRFLPQEQTHYMSWNDRLAQRQQLIAEGLAEQWDSVLAIPVYLDETAGVMRLQDGTVAATLGEKSGLMTTPEGALHAMYDYEFTNDFLQRVYVGADEWWITAYTADNNDVIVLPMESPQMVASSIASNGVLNDGQSYEMQAFDLVRQHVPNSIGSTWTSATASAVGKDTFLENAVTTANEYARKHYLNLPDMLPSQVQALIDQAVSDGVNIEEASSNEEMSRQIAALQYLVRFFTNPDSGFTYTLDAPDGNGMNNMEVINDFLASRAGYCTHYATALAVLGRAMNIPTRIVLGYGANATKDANGWYQVQAGQLHAWTEAYIDNVGWIPFDVTPASSDDANQNATAQPSTPSDQNTQSDSSNDSDVDMTVEPDPNAPNQTDDNASQQGDDSADNAQSHEVMPVWWQSQAVDIASKAFCIVLVMLICALMPAVMRCWKRRRRRNLIIGRASSADGAGEAWRAAWSEIADSAWDAGIRWGESDSDADIARMIVQYCSNNNADADDADDADSSNAGRAQCEQDVLMMSAAAAGAMFGGVSDKDDGLWQRVERVRKALHISGFRQLFPASWRKNT